MWENDEGQLPPLLPGAVSHSRRSAYLQLQRWITVSIGLPAVAGPGDLLPLPKYAVRSFFMADLGFLGSSCSRSLCCFLPVVRTSLIGVAVISSLLRAPFPSSIIEESVYVVPYPLFVFVALLTSLIERKPLASSWM